MLDLIYNLYWTSSCFTDRSLVSWRPTQPLQYFYPPSWLSPSSPCPCCSWPGHFRLILKSSDTDSSRTSLHATTCACGHKMAPGFTCPPFSPVFLLVQPRLSRTSECRKLHRHFKFSSFVFARYKREEKVYQLVSNVYQQKKKRPLLYKKEDWSCETSLKYVTLDVKGVFGWWQFKLVNHLVWTAAAPNTDSDSAGQHLDSPVVDQTVCRLSHQLPPVSSDSPLPPPPSPLRRPHTFHHFTLAPLPSAGKILHTVFHPLCATQETLCCLQTGAGGRSRAVLCSQGALLPQNPSGKGMCLGTGAGWAGVAFLPKKKGRVSHERAALLCYHNTHDILACSHTLECVSVGQAFLAEQWAAAFPADDQSLQSVSVFWASLFCMVWLHCWLTVFFFFFPVHAVCQSVI